MFEKVSKTKVAQILKEAGEQLVAVTAERDELRTKLAAFEQRKQVEKLASDMHAKGITTEPTEHLIESLEKKAQAGQLGALRDAVDMVAPDMWQKMANTATDERSAGGSSDLENYLTSLGRHIQGESSHVHSSESQLRAGFGHPSGSPSGLRSRRPHAGHAHQPGGAHRR